MRKLFLFLIVAFAFTQTRAQYIHKIKADSVLITNDSCTAELNLENSTKHIKGFLYNRGNGRTEFRKAVKLNDSTFVFGDDTLLLGGSGKNFANADLTLTGNRRHTIGNDTLNLNAIVGGDTTQYTQSAKEISITGNLEGWNWGSLLKVSATGWKQDAIVANALGGTAVVARNLTSGGTAIGGYSNGIGIYGTSNDVSAGIGMLNGHGIIAGYYGPNAHGAGLGVYRSSTEGINAVRPMIRMLNNPQVYAGNAVGIGSSIRWEFPSYTNNGSSTMFHGTAELYARMSNLRGATTTSEIGFNAMGDSTMRTIMTLDGHGNIALPDYSGTNWQVSDTSGYKALVVDNAGNVRKFNSWPGGGSSSLNLQQVTTNGNTTSNFINADGGYYQRGITLLHATDSMVRVGYHAGESNTSGTRNVAIGNYALMSNTTGFGNIAMGYNALKANTNSTENVAIGDRCMEFANGEGGGNMAIGSLVLQHVSTGVSNIGIGRNVLANLTTGNNNIALGQYAMQQSTTGLLNIAIGNKALLNTNGSSQIAIGTEALAGSTTGGSNIAVGLRALMNNGTGSGNTALGREALVANTTGNNNTAIGRYAMFGTPENPGGVTSGNTGVGAYSMEGIRGGIGNTCIGNFSMHGASFANNNTVVGDSAFWLAGYPSNDIVNNNTFVGKLAAGNLTIGSQNIAIGYHAYLPSSTGNYQMNIGNLIYGTGVDGFDNTISNGKLGIKTKTPAYELDVNGKLGVRTIDSTATAANVLYQDAATGEIKKAAYSSKQSFAQTATTTIAGIDDETTLVSSGTGSLTIPASAWFAGKSFKISVRGVYSTSLSDPAGITIKIRLGSTVIAQSASMFVGEGRTNVSFEIRADLTCRAIGASGSLYTMGMFYNDDDMHSKIENVATTINLTGSQTLDITAKLSDESAGNAISAFILTFEAIN